ncbi:hypothetical protein AX16_000893 [Volvariella volvacea WC 439]|nr:hypothetical protein AX16_000893 [Volvariella volvacea WC 439]
MSQLPTEEDREELLLSCRYGDLGDVQSYIQKFGPESLATIKDENENTILHMIAANGHTDLLTYLTPHLPPSLLSAQNSSGSTALHWAALNSHLPILKSIIEFPGGPGADLLEIKNAAGRSPIAEAELIGWDEGARWLVGVMKLDEDDGAGKVQEGSEDVGDERDGDEALRGDVDIEIQDADGGVARLSIKEDAANRSQSSSS